MNRRTLISIMVAVTMPTLAACGGGGRSVLQPPAAPVEPAGGEQQAVPPVSGAEGFHEEQGLDISLPPPWEQPPPNVSPNPYVVGTWTDPETGWTYVLYDFSLNHSFLRSPLVIFKPDEWWIEEDYPIDDDTPRWKIYEDAAVEELRSRGYTVWEVQSCAWGGPMPQSYSVMLPEGMTFFDVEYVWAEEFPCIDRVTPAIYIWLD